MITQTKKFYYVELKQNLMTVTLEDFPNGPLPLIWNNQGAYGVIRVERIAAMIEELTDYNNLPKLDRNIKMSMLHWDDTVKNSKNNSLSHVFKLFCGAALNQHTNNQPTD